MQIPNPQHNLYMRRALDLAQLGQGYTAPNPMVGCVIVHNDKIIGEGYHQKWGMPHAEVNAINSVQNKAWLPEATLYVSLEPCSHFGKTPPCADFILAHNIKNVVVGSQDNHAKVAGSGIKKLREAGVHVVLDVLKAECLELNKRFFWVNEHKMPYVVLKWAQTADGFLADSGYASKWISNPLSRTLAHQLRTQEAAILVGSNTALHDNPHLTARHWLGRNPTRVLIDGSGKVPATHKIFDEAAETIVFSGNETPQQILEQLYQMNLHSVLIEGGSYTLQKFINANLWNEAKVFVATELLWKKGIAAPNFGHGQQPTTIKIQQDVLNLYKNADFLVNYN